MLKIILFLFLTCLAEAKEPYFLDGCPLVQLSGQVTFSIMPGAPNYESVDDGDFPSERWFFEPDDQSMKYLRESGIFEVIPEDFRPINEDWKDHVNSIQMSASNELESQFKVRKNDKITLEGWLGSWPTHCYSIFFFEVCKIVN